MPKAYSYLRFSTPEQMQGDSFRRQTALAEEYASRHGLELDRELRFSDLGVSAFRGRNAETGRLGDFLQAIDDELVPQGSMLLVESLDRISRQAARRALRVLEDIVDRGVAVVTLTDGRVYTSDNLNDDPMALLLALLTFIRANEESETKARRLRAAWTGKREAIRDRALTSVCPAWLSLNPETGRFDVIEDRADIVRRIFRMALEGTGLHGIAAVLNAEHVPTFGHRGRKAELWGRSYVAKIVTNPAVYGVLVPHVLEHSGGKKRRRALEPVPDYFPVVVPESDFQALRAARMGVHVSRPREASGTLMNMLAGLAECPVCGGTMTRVTKGPRGGRPRLTCVRAKLGRCQSRSVILDDVESALLATADRIAAEAPVAGADLQEEIERLEVEADVVHELMRDAEADWRASRSEAARDRMMRLSAEWDAAVAAMREAEERRAATGSGLARRLVEFQATAGQSPPDRQRINTVLRQMLKAIVVDAGTGSAVLRWHAGGETLVSFGWGEAP